jgi:hypothetical protein
MVTICICIPEALNSNLGNDIFYPDRFFSHGFPQSFHANIRIVHQLGCDHFSKILPDSPVALPFDCIRDWSLSKDVEGSDSGLKS